MRRDTRNDSQDIKRRDTRHDSAGVKSLRKLFPRATLDLRSYRARRFKYLLTSFSQQMGRGSIGEQQQQLIRRCAALSVLSEELEAKLLDGEHVSGLEYSRLAATSFRLLKQLGLIKPANGDGSTPDILTEGHHPLDDEIKALRANRRTDDDGDVVRTSGRHDEDEDEHDRPAQADHVDRRSSKRRRLRD